MPASGSGIRMLRNQREAPLVLFIPEHHPHHKTERKMQVASAKTKKQLWVVAYAQKGTILIVNSNVSCRRSVNVCATNVCFRTALYRKNPPAIALNPRSLQVWACGQKLFDYARATVTQLTKNACQKALFILEYVHYQVIFIAESGLAHW
jgi:hypothetical protein